MSDCPTPNDIEKYLESLRILNRKQPSTISRGKNREENDQFMLKYRINSPKVKEILESLQVVDFCYIADNRNKGYEHEKLYVFCKRVSFDHWGEIIEVEVYIKINIIKNNGVDQQVVIISFHERNKPITYAFK